MISGYSHAASLQNTAPISEEDKLNERKRDILVLVMRFLYDYGYLNSYHSLCNESSISLGQVDVADNVDLWTIVQEYVDYYNTRFGRPPKLIRQPYANVNEYQQLATAVSPIPQFTPSPVTGSAAVAASPGQQQQQQQSAGLNRHATAPAAVVPRPAVTKQEAKRPAAPRPQPSYSAGQTSGGAAASNAAMDVGFTAFTSKIGSSEQLTQEEFVHILANNPGATVVELFTFNRPKRTNSKRRSAHLALSDEQEDALYSVIGCMNVGWTIKNISPQTRDYMLRRFSIDKDVLQLFFKNRAQKPKRMRGMGDGPEVQGGVEFEEQ